MQTKINEDALFKVTPVFYENYNSNEHIVINQGGTSSGKTYATLQVLFLKAIYTPKIVITVTGQDLPNLRTGAYRDAKNIVLNSLFIQQNINFHNKSELTYYFKNESLIEFKGYEDEQDARSGKRDYLFINEVNGVNKLIFQQLFLRTRYQTFLDYNPSERFWVHDELIGEKDVKLIISDHRHNTFLTQEQHDKIENIKDKELWKVYARGLTGNIQGIIFPDWQFIDPLKYPDCDFFGGLDFGYVNDPTCLVKIAKVGETFFIKELCYTPGMSLVQIREIALANGFNESTPIFCDHDPEQISQLRRLGLTCLPAKKGQGSVKAGILFLKQFKVFVTNDSHNAKEELKRYEWMKDKTGEPLNTPIDNYNHFIDATRIAIYTQYFRT